MVEPKPDLITINLKVSRDMRKQFKSIAKAHGSTMQSILYSLAENYIENADHLKIKIIDMRALNGSKIT